MAFVARPASGAPAAISPAATRQLPSAGDHANQLTDRAHLLQLAKLIEKIIEGEVRFAHLLRHLDRLGEIGVSGQRPVFVTVGAD